MSLDGDELLELAYYRATFADMGRQLMALSHELSMTKLNARPDFVSALVIEGVSKQIDKRIGSMLADAVKNVTATSLLPRIEEVREALAGLPALERRQMEVEGRLLVALAELGLRREAA